MDMQSVLSSFKIKPRGLIHVGAHEGQERLLYQQMGANPVVYVEPIPLVYERLRDNISGIEGHYAIEAVCADKVGSTISFNVASFDQSSSILPLGRHGKIYPQIYYADTISLTSTTIDNIISTKFPSADINIIVLDTQGAELIVLRGATEVLRSTDFLYLEVSEEPLYEGGCSMDELVEFLADLGFRPKAMLLGTEGWGNAIFIHDRCTKAQPRKLDVSGDDVAAGKTARQSSAGWPGAENAGQAVNGGQGESFSFHTQEEEDPWWEVDLGEAFRLSDIVVCNRADGCRDRADTLEVLVSSDGQDWRSLYQHSGPSFGGRDDPLHVKGNGQTARHIRLQLHGKTWLHLDMVNVFGSPA